MPLEEFRRVMVTFIGMSDDDFDLFFFVSSHNNVIDVRHPQGMTSAERLRMYRNWRPIATIFVDATRDPRKIRSAYGDGSQVTHRFNHLTPMEVRTLAHLC